MIPYARWWIVILLAGLLGVAAGLELSGLTLDLSRIPMLESLW